MSHNPEKVKPCPFCGAKQEDLDKGKSKGVYVYNNAPHSSIQQWPHVACLECGAGAPQLKVWNRRAKDSLYVRLLAEKNKYIKLLREELNEVIPFTAVHGWKSTRVEAGKIARERIARLEAKL